MRGYHGVSGKRMYYAHPAHWNDTHSWGKTSNPYVSLFDRYYLALLILLRLFKIVHPHSAYASREYPTGWVGIDGNDEPSEKDFY
jgi:hypothetical protein